MKIIIENFKKVTLYSIGSIVLTTLLSILFSFLKGSNWIQTVLNSNYIVSSLIIAVGVLGFFVPMSLKNLKKSKRLVDHSNIADILREEKEIKLSESLINIYWGICHMIIVGILEIIIKGIL